MNKSKQAPWIPHHGYKNEEFIFEHWAEIESMAEIKVNTRYHLTLLFPNGHRRELYPARLKFGEMGQVPDSYGINILGKTSILEEIKRVSELPEYQPVELFEKETQ